MGYYETINTRPVAFYSLESAPYMDASINRLANLSLSNTLHPLMAFNRGKLAICPPQFTVPSPVSGRAWAVGVAAKTEQGKLFEFTSSSGTGVWYQSGRLYFGLKHADTSTTIASAPFQFPTASNIVAVRDGDAIMLYANGELLASKTIETASPVVVGTTLTIGDSSSAVYAGNIAVWNAAPSAGEIRALDGAYRRYPYRRQISEIVSAPAFTPELLSIDNISIPLRIVSSVSVIEVSEGNYLGDVDSLGTSVAGAVVFGHFVQPETYGTNVRWDASSGATVEYSLDSGTTWQAVNNGRPLDGTVAPATPTALLIRVSFAAGQSVRPLINGLKVIDYLSNVINPLTFTSRVATVSGDVYIPATAHHPQLHGDGMRFYTNGILEIAPTDSDTPVNTASLEVVFGVTTADMTGTKYIINSSPEHSSSISVVAGKLNFTGFSSVHVNGATYASNALTLVPGLNYHLVANYTSANNAKITFGSEGSSITGPISTIMLRTVTMNLAAAQSAFASLMSNATSRTASENQFTAFDTPLSHYGKIWTVRGS